MSGDSSVIVSWRSPTLANGIIQVLRLSELCFQLQGVSVQFYVKIGGSLF